MAPDSDNIRRQSTRRWLYVVICIWTISFIIMAAFSTFALIRSQQVNQRLCEVSDDNRKITINILNVAQQQSLEGASGAFERNIIRQHYNELRALIPPLKCTTQGGPQELEP